MALTNPKLETTRPRTLNPLYLIILETLPKVVGKGRFFSGYGSFLRGQGSFFRGHESVFRGQKGWVWVGWVGWSVGGWVAGWLGLEEQA